MRSSGGLAPLDEAARAAPGACSPGPAGGAVGAGLLARPPERRRARARHGRHVLRRLRDRGRQVAAHRVADDRRPADPAADGRRPHGRRRRRLDRLARPRAGRCGSGPRSAGSDPGPACYGRGGDGADGHRRQPAARLPGCRLDARRRRRARSRRRRARRSSSSATELGLDALETAEGIVRVANQEMVRALRVVTVERGVDPRRFALMPFGGAGPMHAAAIAAELEIEPARSARAPAACSRRSG